MSNHALNIVLTLPEDGPDLDTVRRTARRLGISLDNFVSRAVVARVEETEEELAHPVMRAWSAQCPSPPAGRHESPR